MTTETLTAPREVGVVTHFYNRIGVATVKCEEDVPLGMQVHFKGAHTDFVEPITSMEYERHPITKALKGQEVGVTVLKRVHEGDKVFKED